MAGRRGRLPLVSLLAAALMGSAAGAARAASGVTISPADGASVTVVPTPGFANGPLSLQWSAEFGGCPGSDNIHGSAPETRVAGAGDTDWQGHVQGGPFFGPGTFTTTMTLFPGDAPQHYEWRVRVSCGATAGFAGMNVFSPIATFTLLPKAVPIATRTPTTQPAKPRAGAPVTVRVGVVTKEGGTPITTATILCSAVIAGKPLSRLARGIIEGVAFCRWRVPRSASRKLMRGTITAVLNGERATRSFVRRVSA